MFAEEIHLYLYKYFVLNLINQYFKTTKYEYIVHLGTGSSL